MLKTLCRQYTDLTDAEIEKLERIAEMLPYFCELSNADIFIDCFMKDQEKGVVAAHGRPSAHSQYANNIAGEIVLPKNEPIVFYTRKSGVSIRDAKAVTQENKMVLQKTVPIKNEAGTVIAVLIEETDMTGSFRRAKKMDEIGRTAEQLTETLLDLNGSGGLVTSQISSGIFVFSSDLTATYVNPCGIRMYGELGYPEELTGLSFQSLSLIPEADAEKILAGEETEARDASVGEKDFVVKFSPGTDGDGFIMVVEDVSDLKKKEKALVEKSVMIREMHHRIKNNLQLISSILSMQERRSRCGETKRALRENINRINGIASIHELAIGGNEKETNLKRLLEQVVSTMKSYACTEEKRIDILLTGDELTVDSDKALAVVLIVNELITNSIQHGYRERGRGRIEVSLTAGTVYSSIVVKDDGSGFDTTAAEKTDSLGLELIRLMVQDKLRGELRIESGRGGTTVQFDFRGGGSL